MTEELAKGLLEEYDQGFNNAFVVTIAGLEASLERAREMSEAKELLPGLESAIYVVKGLKEAFDKLNELQITETNGEKTNG